MDDEPESPRLALNYHMSLDEAIVNLFSDGMFSNNDDKCIWCRGVVEANIHYGPCPVARLADHLDNIPNESKETLYDRTCEKSAHYGNLVENVLN